MTLSTTPLFQRLPLFPLRVVLVETSRPGNIGSVARAMKTMGFSELVLVNPRIEGALQHEEAVAFASGAQDVLAGARVVATMAEALDGINFAAAVSARLREFSPPVHTPREVAQHVATGALAEQSPAGQSVAAQSLGSQSPGSQSPGSQSPGSQSPGSQSLYSALLFGNERFGLPNEIVERCNVLVNIPANPEYSSLNLAQAAQVLLYECRMAAIGDAAPAASPVGFHGDAASQAQIEGMYAHLEQALVAIGFLDADNPRKLMPRLKRLFARTGLETEEVNILRGIARQMMARERKPGE
ncbi:RNA methyltransferase [Pseudoduganella umbonata]|nr:RNA methyltransferase [Pseudoduganella umbonata]MBB3224034.1 tRNA/rRNA methyltransferase [Pseudoduganella umbonata]